MAARDLQAFAVRQGRTVDVTLRAGGPEARAGRVPSDVIAVLDVSGSMNSPAEVKNAKGEQEGHGLSVMDIVKHATRTITQSLGAEDRLALVAFDTEARVAQALTPMNDAGKGAAASALARLFPGGGTNIWGGLLAALNLAQERADASRPLHILLLTDGMPTASPPRGEVAQFARHLEISGQGCDVRTLPRKAFTVNTFGFGYSLNSDMLNGLARVGNGSYAFIPDAGMVGTVFVHALAACLSAVPFEADAKLRVRLDMLRPVPGLKLEAPLITPGTEVVPDGHDLELALPLTGLRYGQPRDVQFRLELPADVDENVLGGVTIEAALDGGFSVLPVAEAVPADDAAEAGEDNNSSGGIVAAVSTAMLGLTGLGGRAAAQGRTAAVGVDLSVELNLGDVRDGADGVHVGNGSGAAPIGAGDALETRGRLVFANIVGDIIGAARGPNGMRLDSNVIQNQQLSAAALVAQLRGLLDQATSLGAMNAAARLEAILADVDGQVSEACSKEEYMRRWGLHFLPSLVRAHELQTCNNFKDPGVQAYGGDLFRALRDAADDAFNELPPPTPTRPAARRGRMTGGRMMPVPTMTSMRVYNSRSNGCFHGKSVVTQLLPSGKRVEKRLDEVRMGDRLLTGAGTFVPVRCVVKTVSNDGTFDLVTLPGSGLCLTPWHPVFLPNGEAAAASPAGEEKEPQLPGRWVYPMALQDSEPTPCAAVFSILFERSHAEPWTGQAVVVDGVAGAALGHGLDDDEVIAHPFFGSYDNIEANLAPMAGFEKGIVTLREGSCLKNAFTQLVCSFDPDYVLAE
mmetsp:Transcript_26881/g.84236  ORF Transcript_26881/g.84236 Transcript_26881/m.84236 type:complete len:801 (-) Transcript_26881:31-2433(-)